MAYIDPSTGGVLFQVLAMGFAVLSGVVLIFSRQIRAGLARARRLLRGLRKQDDQRVGADEPLSPQSTDRQIGDS